MVAHQERIGVAPTPEVESRDRLRAALKTVQREAAQVGRNQMRFEVLQALNAAGMRSAIALVLEQVPIVRAS